MSSAKGSFGSRKVFSGSRWAQVGEGAFYVIEIDDIEQILAAKKIEMRVVGDYYIDAIFTDKNKQRLNQFYQKFIKKK